MPVRILRDSKPMRERFKQPRVVSMPSRRGDPKPEDERPEKVPVSREPIERSPEARRRRGCRAPLPEGFTREQPEIEPEEWNRRARVHQAELERMTGQRLP